MLETQLQHMFGDQARSYQYDSTAGGTSARGRRAHDDDDNDDEFVDGI